MSTAAQRSPAGAGESLSVGTLLSAAGVGRCREACPVPESAGEGLHGRGQPGTAGRPPCRYRRRAGAAAAVPAICSGQLPPSLFCGGERASEPSLREGEEGERLWLPSGTQQCREKADKGSDSRETPGPVPAAPAALCVTAPLRHSLGTEGKEWEGKPGSSLALARVSYSFPPVLLCQAGVPAVRARVRAGAAAGFSGRAPCPGTRALPRVGKPRPRAPRPPLPAAFPLRFYNDFLPEKSNLFARQVRRDQQSVVYYVFIFLSSPPALYRLTVDLTFGISAHTQQLNGNKLSTFTSDKHYP